MAKGVRMELEGFEATMRALRAAPYVVRSHASQVVGTSTFALAQRARALVPVDTGALKASITTAQPTAKGLSGRVGVSAGGFYWRFVEYGTVHMPARPFFRSAAEEEREHFIERMRRIGSAVERDMSTGRFV